MSVVGRYILREILTATLAVLAALLVIFLVHRFAVYLGDAAEGSFPASIILTLLGIKLIDFAILLLPLSFYLGTVLALGRLSQDSELTAMAACGVNQGRVNRPIWGLALVLMLVVGALTTLVAPRTAQMQYEVRAQAESQVEYGVLAAGRFQEVQGGNAVYYVAQMQAERMRNVFLQQRKADDPAQVAVQWADSARQETDPQTGARYLVLEDGYRYEGTPGQPDYRITRYDTMRVWLRPPAPVDGSRRRNAKPTAELWDSSRPAEQAELQWRLSVPLSVLVLALLAPSLSRASPRQGRYGRLVTAILIYVIYLNLLWVGQTWVEQGKVPFWLGMWWVHAGFALIGFLLWRRGRRLGGSRRRWARS